MSGGIGPIEPGEGTEAHESPHREPRTPRGPRWARELYAGHRRAVLAAAALTCASAVAVASAAIYAARPRPAPYVPPAPSQVFSLTYVEPLAPTPAGNAFAFTVRVRTASGPAVTLERLSQPSRALKVEIEPSLPATVAAGETRDLVVRIQVTDCVHVARNSGLPLIEVTLSNEFQKEEHTYIPGDLYARDLSVALTRACPATRDEVTRAPS
ncbi:Tat pathway signal sequence domain protein [Streptomyces sp. NPDC054956]